MRTTTTDSLPHPVIAAHTGAPTAALLVFFDDLVALFSIAPPPDALIRPADRTLQHLRGELDQLGPYLLDLLRGHTRSQPPSIIDIEATRRDLTKHY
jgi:hypothetical protein